MKLPLLMALAVLPGWAGAGAPVGKARISAPRVTINSSGDCRLVTDDKAAALELCERAKTCFTEHAGSDERVLECIRVRLGHAAPVPMPGRATTVAELSRKLASGGFRTSFNGDGRLIECKVTKSTGDADLDRGACDVQRACNGLDAQARGTCMDRMTRELFARLAAERAPNSSPK
jgi:hypothetical protein